MAVVKLLKKGARKVSGKKLVVKPRAKPKKLTKQKGQPTYRKGPDKAQVAKLKELRLAKEAKEVKAAPKPKPKPKKKPIALPNAIDASREFSKFINDHGAPSLTQARKIAKLKELEGSKPKPKKTKYPLLLRSSAAYKKFHKYHGYGELTPQKKKELDKLLDRKDKVNQRGPGNNNPRPISRAGKIKNEKYQ